MLLRKSLPNNSLAAQRFGVLGKKKYLGFLYNFLLYKERVCLLEVRNIKLTKDKVENK